MKIPRDLSGRELVQILTKNLDYKIIHRRGSHMVLETSGPSQHRITIPDHKALRIGRLLLFPRNFAKQKKPCRQETAFLFTSTDKVMESGWADLNRRPHAPQTCTLTNCATARCIKLQVVESITGSKPMSTRLQLRPASCGCPRDSGPLGL